MSIEQIDLAKLKKLPKNKRQKKIEEIENQKTLLIEKYLKLQDMLDQYSQEIYDLSCEIEQMNIVITELSPQKKEKKEKKKEKKKSKAKVHIK